MELVLGAKFGRAAEGDGGMLRLHWDLYLQLPSVASGSSSAFEWYGRPMSTLLAFRESVFDHGQFNNTAAEVGPPLSGSIYVCFSKAADDLERHLRLSTGAAVVHRLWTIFESLFGQTPLSSFLQDVR